MVLPIVALANPGAIHYFLKNRFWFLSGSSHINVNFSDSMFLKIFKRLFPYKMSSLLLPHPTPWTIILMDLILYYVRKLIFSGLFVLQKILNDLTLFWVVVVFLLSPFKENLARFWIHFKQE
jgi:hypothetical protein